MTPSRDPAQSNANQYAYRTALWFYASGNSGIIWESETTSEHWASGGGSACQAIRGGQIAFVDKLANRLMVYDPATGGVAPIASISKLANESMTVKCLSTISDKTTTTLSLDTSTLQGKSVQVGTTLSSPDSAEKIVVDKVLTQAASGTASVQVIRGWAGTSPSTLTFQNGHTLTITQAQPPVYNLVYDPNAETLNLIYSKDQDGNGPFTSGVAGYAFGGIDNVQSYYSLRGAVAPKGVVASSNFDFNSSLQKYFRSVAIDGDALHTSRSDEVAGTFDIYVKVDGVTNTTVGATLIQANATPGTFYNINLTGQSICVIVQLNPGATSSASPYSFGPILRRVSVKGVPIMPGYRRRHYSLALYDDLELKDGGREQNTPAQLRKALEALITSNTPVAVYDTSMSNVSMVFVPEECKVREIRPNEYTAYVSLREV
jgi:hypothetical protein